MALLSLEMIKEIQAVVKAHMEREQLREAWASGQVTAATNDQALTQAAGVVPQAPKPYKPAQSSGPAPQ